MAVKLADYADPKRAVRWFDVDPSSVDPLWTSWVALRVYAFIPNLGRMLDNLTSRNFGHLAEVANVRLEEANEPLGLIKKERLTGDQIKAAVGAGGRNGSGQSRPIRVDKALLTVFAINSELSRLGQPLIEPTIFLSAFSLAGLGKAFNQLSKDEKQKIRIELGKIIDQPAELCSDLLKGNKVSIDIAIQAHTFLCGRSEFAKTIDQKIERAIESPTMKHTIASGFEDFSTSRLPVLPSPFKRPER